MNTTATAICLILAGILLAIALSAFAPAPGGVSSHPKGIQIPLLAQVDA